MCIQFVKTLHDIVALVTPLNIVTISVVNHFINNDFSLTEVSPMTDPCRGIQFPGVLYKKAIYLWIRRGLVSFKAC